MLVVKNTHIYIYICFAAMLSKLKTIGTGIYKIMVFKNVGVVTIV